MHGANKCRCRIRSVASRCRSRGGRRGGVIDTDKKLQLKIFENSNKRVLTTFLFFQYLPHFQ
ncbi:unnamed protein product [Amoebophrya sp. A25]|nr:unnamed protein product [Amoebophrya sp. A25]|eukprot:GSA25T00020483001.1